MIQRLDVFAMLAAVGCCSEVTSDVTAHVAGIDFSSLVSKLLGPTFLQYLNHPSEEKWLSVDKDLRLVRKCNKQSHTVQKDAMNQ